MGPDAITIVCTYDSSTQTLSCNPETVKVLPNEGGQITVTLQTGGGPGTIAFAPTPIAWNSVAPLNVAVNVNSESGETSLTITDPNYYYYQYPFTVYAYYTPPGGSTILVSGDPTIVNEGTGMTQTPKS